MELSLIIGFVAGISIVLASSTKGANETDVKILEKVDFGEVESDSESVEIQRKRDSGYSYIKPIRFNRPRFHFGLKGRFSKQPNQSNRPFNQYGLPSTGQEQNNQPRPHNQYRQPNQSPNNLPNQGIPNPIKNHEFSTSSPIASQNNEPFRIGTANYLPPKNQKLPIYSTPNAFSNSQQESTQGHLNQQIQSQNFVQEGFQDQRISDAALFLTQNAQTLSQLYGAPAPNQEYAPNNEYLNQLSNQQHFENNLNSHTENIQDSQGSQGFPRPSYASGILNSQETLENIQSLEKDRLISQLRQALVNQAQFQNLESPGRNAPTQENVQQSGSGLSNPGGPQLVSPSVFGGEQTAFGHVPFLSGSAISPPGFGLGYGLSTPGQVPTTAATTPQPPGPIGGASSPPASFTPSFSSGFPQYGTYIPTLIPGTNFVTNIPGFGSGLYNPSSINTPNYPAISTPTQFGIPIPISPGQKPVSGTPTLTIAPAVTPVKPVHPSNTPAIPAHNPVYSETPVVQPVPHPVRPVHPVGNPSHPVATPVFPIRPVTTPVYPVVSPVHPTYGVQSNFVNSLFLKPVKPIYPVYYYPNIPFQVQKPVSTTQPWNYAPAFQQNKPIWK